MFLFLTIMCFSDTSIHFCLIWCLIDRNEFCSKIFWLLSEKISKIAVPIMSSYNLPRIIAWDMIAENIAHFEFFQTHLVSVWIEQKILRAKLGALTSNILCFLYIIIYCHIKILTNAVVEIFWIIKHSAAIFQKSDCATSFIIILFLMQSNAKLIRLIWFLHKSDTLYVLEYCCNGTDSESTCLCGLCRFPQKYLLFGEKYG